jgi:hypothetical protein
VKLQVWLLICTVVASASAHSLEVAVFDASPRHAWNRLYAALGENALAAREPSQESDETALIGKSYESLLSALDDFLMAHAEKAIDTPVKRAILQSAVWATFDRVSDPAAGHQANRTEIARRCMTIIQRLALSDREIAELPDNYLATVKRKVFPTTYDPSHRERSFLPEDLLDEAGPWLMMGGSEPLRPAAAMHSAAAQGRSVFYVLIRLPDGRQATLAYLRQLADFPQPYVLNDTYSRYPYARSPVLINPDVPQLPQGTQVALVRRMLLTNSKGELVVTPIIESVQLRVYRKDPKSAQWSDPDNQDFHELRLAPDELFKGTGGLRASPSDQGDDVVTFDKPSLFTSAKGACNGCHAPVGVLSLNTYTHAFGETRPNTPWFEPSKASSQNDYALNWKKRDYTWGLFRGMLDTQHAPVRPDGR